MVCYIMSTCTNYGSLFSGGLKPGFRQLRNSSKLSFQSVFSSESSMRASTHRLLGSTHTVTLNITDKKHTVETIVTFECFMPPSTGVHANVGSHQGPSVKFAQAQIGPETA